MNKLREISFDLQLEPSDSEWGIVNSNAQRVVEFIEYYFGHDIKGCHYDYLNLVFDSMNDALLEKRVDQKTKDFFKKFVCDIVPKEQLFCSGVGSSYWRNIDENNQEFPVIKLLKSILDT